VNHIDTSDFYGPNITNQLIRKSLHPYPDDLVIITKISVRRGADGSWLPAMLPEELRSAVHDNLRNLGFEALDIVNFRSMLGQHGPTEGSIAPQVDVLAELQREGLVRHIGVSNVDVRARSRSARIVCVQNSYNIAVSHDCFPGRAERQ